MKSTFQKEVYCDKNPDGSFLIRFSASKGSAHDGAGSGRNWVAARLISIIFIIIGIPLLFVFGLGIIFIALGAYAFYSVSKISDKPASLTVIPNEGIRWGGNQLAFSDIKQIGVAKLSSKQSKHDSSGSTVWVTGYVYAKSGGREIQLTLHMPVARAEAVRDAIFDCSGVTWN